MPPYAKKSLGQNFLVDPNYKRKILEAVRSTKAPALLEIGPGRGALTRELVGLGSPLWLIEKDTELVEALKQEFAGSDKVHVTSGDFLELDLNQVLNQAPKPMTVAGNLPYNVASQIFIGLIENHSLFSDLFLMFQKEMALRFIAKPDTKDYGLLSLWAQVYSQPVILFHLPPSVFRPQPKVTSSFVHFPIRQKPLIESAEHENFFILMRTLFQSRRKMIGSTLKKAGRDTSKIIQWNEKRAEDLSVEELIELFRRMK